LYFLLELAEWSSVSGLILLEEFEYLLDSLGAQLLTDRVKVLTFVLPELDLSKWVWVISTLESALWILLKDVLDLPGPVKEGTFKTLGFVFAR